MAQYTSAETIINLINEYSGGKRNGAMVYRPEVLEVTTTDVVIRIVAYATRTKTTYVYPSIYTVTLTDYAFISLTV